MYLIFRIHYIHYKMMFLDLKISTGHSIENIIKKYYSLTVIYRTTVSAIKFYFKTFYEDPFGYILRRKSEIVFEMLT